MTNKRLETDKREIGMKRILVHKLSLARAVGSQGRKPFGV
jgi:hypothetical protein